jgi:catechol 2,3-dioxygenase-like lactoylglutathione lyase family enzyme
MLKDIDSSAIVATSDLKRARHFYGNIVGLPELSGDDNVVTYQTGKTTLVVYVSSFAGTNKANAVVWGVGDQVEAIAADLIARGASFEHYPDMGMDYANGVHSAGDFKAAWLKDPDGNILHFNSM